MRCVRRGIHASAVALLIAVAGVPDSVRAQAADSCSGDVRIGFSTAVGELRDVASVGPVLGFGFGCPLGERLSIRTSADAAIRIGPNMHMLHLLAGPHLTLTAPYAQEWKVAARIEAGWTYVPTFGSNPTVSPPPRWALMSSGLTAGGGVRFRRQTGDIVSIVADLGIRMVFVGTEDVIGFQGNVAEGFDTAIAIPVTVGIEFRI